MASIPTILVTFVTVSLLFRYFLFPLLFARLTQFRLSYFSIFSARGLEYRPRGQSGAVVPTLRVERLGWAWGGLCDDDVGLLVIRVEGVSLRVKRSSEDNDKQVPDRAVSPTHKNADFSLPVGSHIGKAGSFHRVCTYLSTIGLPSLDSSLSRYQTFVSSLTTLMASSLRSATFVSVSMSILKAMWKLLIPRLPRLRPKLSGETTLSCPQSNLHQDPLSRHFHHLLIPVSQRHSQKQDQDYHVLPMHENAPLISTLACLVPRVRSGRVQSLELMDRSIFQLQYTISQSFSLMSIPLDPYRPDHPT